LRLLNVCLHGSATRLRSYQKSPCNAQDFNFSVEVLRDKKSRHMSFVNEVELNMIIRNPKFCESPSILHYSLTQSILNLVLQALRDRFNHVGE